MISPLDTLERIPPQSVSAEQACLGAMLLDREAIERAEELLRTDDFYKESHRLIFSAMLDLFSRKEPVDLITLGESLQARGHLEQIGGVLYLTTLMEAVPTAAGIVQYAAIVRTKARQRQLIKVTDEIMAASYDADDMDALLGEAEQKIFAIRDRGQSVDFTSDRIGQLMTKEFNRLDDEAEYGTVPERGLLSNLPGLNAVLTPGLERGTVLVLAGSTSTGKTTCAMTNFAWPAARAGATVLVLSCEMAQRQIAMRSLISVAAVAGWKLQDTDYRLKAWGQRTGDDDPLAVTLSAMIQETWDDQLYVRHEPSLTPLKTAALARRMRKERGLDLLIIDGLWLMQGDKREQTRRAEYETISRQIKILAGELDIPIILLHQISRGYAARPDKRPMMTDLRETGAVEQDADQVLFTHRPSFVGQESPPNNFLPGQSSGFRQKAWEHYTEFLLRKNRNGAPGKALGYFDAEHVRFVEWTDRYEAVELGGN